MVRLHSLFFILTPKVYFDCVRMVRLGFLFFILTSKVNFHWARGANGTVQFLVLDPLSECLFLLGAGRECEGKNQKEREVFARLRSPLSFRFSPSRSLFPYPLLSESGALCSACRIREMIRSFKPQFIRATHAKQTARIKQHCSPSSLRQARDFRHKGKGNEERGARGENLKGKGECELASFPLLLWVLPSHSRPAPNEN